MKLPNIIGAPNPVDSGPDAGSRSELGLPALISIAGVVVAVVLAAAASLDTWVGSEASNVASVQPATVIDPDSSTMFMSRQIDMLQSKLEGLELRFEQVAAGNQDLVRKVQDLQDKLGPYTASIGPQDVRAANSKPRKTGKQNRSTVQFKTSHFEDSETPVTQTQFGLELPSFRSLKELHAGWQHIRRRTGPVLRGLQPRYYALQLDNASTVYRLVAGPIRDAANAAIRCAKLNDINVKCKTTVFAGEQLSRMAGS